MSEWLFDAEHPPHLHVGRSFTGNELERLCPCKLAACGLVDSEQIDETCKQHALRYAQTMRQGHFAEHCPAQWSEDES